MDVGSIHRGVGTPTAATPPTQPATPPNREAVNARAQAVRHHAVQCAIAYAAAGLAVTTGQFWQAVDAFEQYIGTGVHQ